MDENVQRVLHTSTSEVYGTALFVPITEEHPLQGQSPYSASKIGADKMAEAFAASFELEVVTVRPFNTFGPRQSMRAVIPTIISQCLRGNDVKLGACEPHTRSELRAKHGRRLLRGGSVTQGRPARRSILVRVARSASAISP